MPSLRNIAVLQALAAYFLLNRPQIQSLCFETDHEGSNLPRITRRQLQKLVSAGFINRNAISAAPVYFLAKRGCELPAEHFGDDRFLLLPTRLPQIGHLQHCLAVSDTHIALTRAIERQTDVSCDRWINEFEIVNADERTEGNSARRTLQEQIQGRYAQWVGLAVSVT